VTKEVEQKSIDLVGSLSLR